MGQLVFQATLGGAVNLVGPNTASTFNLNVPAVSSTIATLAAQTFAGTQTFTVDSVVNGLTVGRGAGAVSTNTAVGASALSGNTSGGANTSIGYQSGGSNTTGASSTYIGYQAGLNDNGVGVNTFVGSVSGTTNTTGTELVGVGTGALRANTTGSYSVAIGRDALRLNTTASNNTAVGYQAGYSTTTGAYNCYFGYTAAKFGTGAANTVMGHAAAVSASFSGNANTIIGTGAGEFLTTGSSNTFVGGGIYGVSSGAGSVMTTGSKNTIIGNYTGNQGGLDIRTASNYIVLSDGDGNPRAFCNGSGYWVFGGSSTLSSAQNSIFYTPGTTYGLGFKPSTNSNTPKPCSFLEASGVEVGSITTSGSATLYNVTSDQRLKENIVNAPDFGSVIDSLQVRSFDWKSDSTHQRAGFIAQELVAVAPEAVYQPVDTEQMMAVDYSKLVPMLVKEVQSLRARVAQLEGN